MEIFPKLDHCCKLLAVFAKNSILDVREDSEFASFPIANTYRKFIKLSFSNAFTSILHKIIFLKK